MLHCVELCVVLSAVSLIARVSRDSCHAWLARVAYLRDAGYALGSVTLAMQCMAVGMMHRPELLCKVVLFMGYP